MGSLCDADKWAHLTNLAGDDPKYFMPKINHSSPNGCNCKAIILPKLAITHQNLAKLSPKFAQFGFTKGLRLCSGESNRPLTPILLKSIAIHLPFLSRYFGKSMPSSWQKVLYTPPICITIRLPFVSRYFFGSIRVRGRWNTPNLHTSGLGSLQLVGGFSSVVF